MENDQNKEQQENDSEAMEDLDLGEKAEDIAGGARPRNDPDAGRQLA